MAGKVGVGLLGLGTVGGGVASILQTPSANATRWSVSLS